MVANKAGLYIVDPDRNGVAPSKPNARAIIKFIPKLPLYP